MFPASRRKRRASRPFHPGAASPRRLEDRRRRDCLRGFAAPWVEQAAGLSRPAARRMHLREAQPQRAATVRLAARDVSGEPPETTGGPPLPPGARASPHRLEADADRGLREQRRHRLRLHQLARLVEVVVDDRLRVDAERVVDRRQQLGRVDRVSSSGAEPVLSHLPWT